MHMDLTVLLGKARVKGRFLKGFILNPAHFLSGVHYPWESTIALFLSVFFNVFCRDSFPTFVFRG